MSPVGIVGLGTYLPPTVRTNDWWSKQTVAQWAERMALQATRAAAPTDSMTVGQRLTLQAMGELATDPGLRTAAPTVLVGDFNSRADGSTTPTYANLLAAGFGDAWVQARPNDVGLTCCFGEDLRVPGGPFYSRIDYVLVRNRFRGVAAGIVGAKQRDRMAGLWPSDHAGVWARLLLP